MCFKARGGRDFLLKFFWPSHSVLDDGGGRKGVFGPLSGFGSRFIYYIKGLKDKLLGSLVHATAGNLKFMQIRGPIYSSLFLSSTIESCCKYISFRVIVYRCKGLSIPTQQCSIGVVDRLYMAMKNLNI